MRSIKDIDEQIQILKNKIEDLEQEKTKIREYKRIKQKEYFERNKDTIKQMKREYMRGYMRNKRNIKLKESYYDRIIKLEGRYIDEKQVFTKKDLDYINSLN